MAISICFGLNGGIQPGEIENIVGDHNDIHLSFAEGKSTIWFGKNGTLIGKPQPGPPKANDVGWTFDNKTGAIKTAFWTEGGKKLTKPKIVIPKGADGVRLDVGGKFREWWFTKDGVRIDGTGGVLKVPRDSFFFGIK